MKNLKDLVQKSWKLRLEVCNKIFTEIVQPYLDSKGLDLRWAMGSVFTVSFPGRSKEDDGWEKILLKVQSTYEQFPFHDDPRCQALWWVLSAIYPAGRYTKASGLIAS